jgi:iron(III) transport system ATP-binding protein
LLDQKVSTPVTPRTGMSRSLTIAGLKKTFGAGVVAVKSVDVQVADTTIHCLLGPSGCGKTTILRMIAGLETPDAGLIRYGEQDLYNSGGGVNLQPHQRKLGMVFQSYALWPHMSTHQNVAFPLAAASVPRSARRELVDRALARVGLQELGSRKISELSGGQQQRVALARAIVGEPRLILFDEPLSNLDMSLRISMRRDIRALMTESGMSGVYVTHDQSEAFAIADVISVLCEGEVRQSGSPAELATAPKDAFVARFLQVGAVVQAKLVDADTAGRRLRVSIADQELDWELSVPLPESRQSGQMLEICLPHRVVSLAASGIPGRVQWVELEPTGGCTVGVAVTGQSDVIPVRLEDVDPAVGVGTRCHIQVHGPVIVLA